MSQFFQGQGLSTLCIARLKVHQEPPTTRIFAHVAFLLPHSECPWASYSLPWARQFLGAWLWGSYNRPICIVTTDGLFSVENWILFLLAKIRQFLMKRGGGTFLWFSKGFFPFYDWERRKEETALISMTERAQNLLTPWACLTQSYLRLTY